MPTPTAKVRGLGWRAAAGGLMLGLLGGCAAEQPDAGDVGSNEAAIGATSYSGRAAVLDADILGITTGVLDTGPLPLRGGVESVALPVSNIPGLLTATALDASAIGSGDETVAQVTAANVHLALTVGDLTLLANLVSSTATAECANGVPQLSGGSTVVGLTLNGKAINVTGASNQTLNLLLGKIVINEHVTTVAGSTGSVQVAPIHVELLGLADVNLAVSEAGITCPPPGI